MKTINILEAANKYYPDEALSNYYNREGEITEAGIGDGLAEFIVREIVEYFKSESTKVEPFQVAIYLLEQAKNDLDLAIKGLEEKRNGG